jgi:succinate dehydrogenase/fumarate reductase flavoprotein subunit
VALYDIVVVGSGGTGLMAAYAAAKAGARVLVLEKGKQLGGTTAMSVGTVAASATRLQREHGIDDNPDAHFEDMGLFKPEMANRDHLGFRRLLVDHAPETIALLEEMGVVFMGPLPEPPHRVPRLHAIIPHSRGFIDHLSKACARHGVDIKTSQRVMRLIYADDRVKGVVVETEQASAQEICAERGVMGLAVGGVVLNGDLAWGPELRFVAPQKPSIISRLPTWPMLAKILLRAMKVTPDFFMRPFLMRFVTTFLAPSPNLFRKGAILVNQQGERFCDERDRPQDHLGRQQPDYGYIIFGGEIAQLFGAWPNYISTAPGVGYAYLKDYEAARQDIVHKYDNLQDLAQRLSLSYEALKQAVDQHNSVAKSDTTLKPIQQGPYYALGPVKSWIVFSEGGLKIDMQFRVLDQNNKPIAGLFAAGSAGQGGVLLDGHGHHLGWAFTSGRLAGHNAAMMK